MTVTIKIGDCVEVLKAYPECHFDSCVTDPPYGIAFMGEAWDKVEVYSFSESWAKEVYRVLKPGAWLLSFGGTRTYHRMTCALEDVGFEIRDCMMWLYGSGFPKSYDISKGIDKHLGLERGDGTYTGPNFKNAVYGEGMGGGRTISQSPPISAEARNWSGWGTALKPAWEPIVVARKPLDGTVAGNTLKWGTGGINVDGCRIGVESHIVHGKESGEFQPGDGQTVKDYHPVVGRWPSNLLLDEDSARMLDEQSGESESKPGIRNRTDNNIYGVASSVGEPCELPYSDRGGASRFFYTAKASRGERERGVKGEKSPAPWAQDFGSFKKETNRQPVKNIHPTVKPLDLMQYLVRLVTPKGGVCLDPFVGSGTTLLACQVEGFDAIGIEKNPEYEPIIKGRLSWSLLSYDGRQRTESAGA